MQKIILCDSNAVIQLAIISKKAFHAHSDFELILHKDVVLELKGLLRNPDKQVRLGDVIDWVLCNLSVSAKYSIPKDWKDIDEVYRCQELGMLSSEKSSPTSEKDRKYLILADTNGIGLLTREKTLYNLSKNIIGLERTFGISDFLIMCKEANIITVKDINAGLKLLTAKKETLPERCKSNLKDLGAKF